MHINATGVAFPFLEWVAGVLTRRRVILLNAQIANGMACRSDGSKQLRLAVKQGLSPLGMAGSHGQHSAAQRQRLAMT